MVHRDLPAKAGSLLCIAQVKLAERGAQLSNKLWVREFRKLNGNGHQTPILTTTFQAPMTTLAVGRDS